MSETAPELQPNDKRRRYSKETKQAALKGRLEGATFSSLSKLLDVPITTLQLWQREHDRDLVLKFPGGSEYRAAKNGTIKRVESQPDVAGAAENDLVDEILEEVAFKIGRLTIECASLKARLKRRA